MFYTDNTEDLNNICNEIKTNTNLLAVDTEFYKRNEYFPTISLIQLSYFDGNAIKHCIIDVLSDEIDLQQFHDILNDEKIKKIFHSCSQDLEGLYCLFGDIPKSIEDTQVMAEFCGFKKDLSYTDLIKETLKIIVKKDKAMQISNWLKRPLTNRQLEYAINDVDYLLEIYIYLLQKLDLNKNFKFYKAEIYEKYEQNMIEYIKNNAWKKVRFKLGDRTNNYMNLMKKICIVREEYAMKNNIIKKIVLSDNSLRKLMIVQPKSISEWNNEFSDNMELMSVQNELKRKFIETFINFTLDVEQPYIMETKDTVILNKYEKIVDYIISTCKNMNIASEIILNKIDLISYLTDSERLENIFENWKIELFGKELDKIKNSL